MKLWILTNSPSPYQVEFFRALHALPELDIDVRFMQRKHRGLDPLAGSAPGFPYACLRSIGLPNRPAERHLHPGALREVCRGGHDAYILSGHYTSSTFLLCAVLLKLRRRPGILWLERPWPDDDRSEWATKRTAKSALARRLRRRLLTGLVRQAAGVFAIGSLAAEAYRNLGAHSDTLFNLPYLCDTTRFENVPAENVYRIRERLKLADRTVFLFSGALTFRKGIDTLLQAFERLAAETDNAALLVLGEGDLRERLENGLSPAARPRVHFVGHAAQEELPAYFGAADVFVFPSRYDGWGVVIDEACAAGLPVIATRQTGAARDLVEEGKNGFVLDRDDTAGFHDKMLVLLNDPGMRRSFSECSRSIVRAYTVSRGAERFRDAVAACLETYGSD